MPVGPYPVRRRRPREQMNGPENLRQVGWRFNHGLLSNAERLVDLLGIGSVQNVAAVLLSRWVKVMWEDPEVKAKAHAFQSYALKPGEAGLRVDRPIDLVVTGRDVDAEAAAEAAGQEPWLPREEEDPEALAREVP
jgi:hypothetical protein